MSQFLVRRGELVGENAAPLTILVPGMYFLGFSRYSNNVFSSL